MKRKLIFAVAVFAALLSFNACQEQNVEAPENDAQISFVAEAETGVDLDTKAYLDGFAVRWNKGDKIGVWATKENGKKQLYSFTNKNENGPTGRFTGTYNASNSYDFAVFPLGTYGEYDDYFFEIPSEYSSYTSGQVVAPMIAIIDSDVTGNGTDGYQKLQFKHIFGLVKITINDLPETTSSFSISYTGAGNINGKVSILTEKLNAENIKDAPFLAELVQIGSGSKTVTFRFDPLEERTDMVFYLPLSPGYHTGFTAKISNGIEDLDLFKITKSNAVQRAKVHELPAVSAAALEYAPAPNVDMITADDLVATDTSYKDFSNVSFNTEAVYAGNNAKNNSGDIQLRSNNNNSGIVTTASAGTVSKVRVTWGSSTANGRTIDVYGKNTQYDAASDLYDNTKKGTLIGSIVCGTSDKLVISGDYAFIGIRSNSGALYCSDIKVEWNLDESEAIAAPTGLSAAVGGVNNEINVSWNAVSGAASYSVSIVPADAAAQIVNGTSASFTDLQYNTEYTVTVRAIPLDTDSYKQSDPVTTTVTTGASSAVVLWSEDWTGGAANAKPSEYGKTGTTVYGGGTVTYSEYLSGTKLYTQTLAGGTSPELLIAKKNEEGEYGSWTISGIPTAAASSATLTFKVNKTSISVSSPTSGVSISGSGKSRTISFSSVTKFDLVFTATSSDNIRIDDIKLEKD